MNKIVPKNNDFKKNNFSNNIFKCLNGCVQNTALLGPAYTLTSTGNVFQAGLSYGSNKAVTSITGKTPGENIKNLLHCPKSRSDFEKLIKKRIKETRKKINRSSRRSIASKLKGNPNRPSIDEHSLG